MAPPHAQLVDLFGVRQPSDRNKRRRTERMRKYKKAPTPAKKRARAPAHPIQTSIEWFALCVDWFWSSKLSDTMRGGRTWRTPHAYGMSRKRGRVWKRLPKGWVGVGGRAGDAMLSKENVGQQKIRKMNKTTKTLTHDLQKWWIVQWLIGLLLHHNVIGFAAECDTVVVTRCRET